MHLIAFIEIDTCFALKSCEAIAFKCIIIISYVSVQFEIIVFASFVSIHIFVGY